MYENERREREAIIRNGWPLIVVPLVLGVGGGCVLCPVFGLPWVATAWLAVCLVFAAFMAWFFRNPKRTPPEGEENIVSGAEGTVRSVQYVTEDDGSPASAVVKEFFPGQRAVRISTFLSPLHVHVNRLSIGGTVKQCEYRHGKHLLTMDERSSLYNQHSIVVVEDKDAVALYGLMQRHIKQRDGEDASTEAQAILEDNGEERNITVSALGDFSVIAGETVVVRQADTGLSGIMWVDADVHTFADGLHKMQLTLNLKNVGYEADAGRGVDAAPIYGDAHDPQPYVGGT